MRKIAKIAAICAVFGLALGFMSCSNGSDAPYVPQPTGLSVTVTFNPNGGTITTTTQTVPANTATALKTAAALGLSREGYTFGGWAKASSVTAADYADGASVTLSANLTLYALWTAAPTPTPTPTGGINGLFSVSATKKVYFSKGNLQATCKGSSWTWSFADHQYDAFGEAGANTLINGNGTVSADGSVDLFGWVGANSAFTDMAAFGISNSEDNKDYGNVNGEALKNDWGTNAISNGGNVANYGWRTLTKDEWNYVLTTRAGADSKKGAATVNNVAGWILLPDAWTLPAGASFTAGKGSGFTTNSYTAEQWAVMESAGAVFLPLTGTRHGSTVQYSTDYGYYWSATSASATAAYIAAFSASSSSCIDMGRGFACSAVRLAKDSN